MAKKVRKPTGKKGAKKASKKSVSSVHLHPGMTAMLARTGDCNKPPIQWLKQADGSWLECYLRSDCTYGNCHEVSASDVPAAVRNG